MDNHAYNARLRFGFGCAMASLVSVLLYVFHATLSVYKVTLVDTFWVFGLSAGVTVATIAGIAICVYRLADTDID